MTDDRFDLLMRDAARTYNTPPPAAPLDEMWQTIERKLDGPAAADAQRADPSVAGAGRRRLFRRPGSTWLGAAAVLLLGVGLGRASVSLLPGQSAAESDVSLAGADVVEWQVEEAWPSEQYLGETTALLIALPVELESKRPDSTFATRADELLLQTRLLLDSPTPSDPPLRALLEDLEVVLVQVVRLHADRDPMKIDLLKQALVQGELMPRLQSAVISHAAD